MFPRLGLGNRSCVIPPSSGLSSYILFRNRSSAKVGRNHVFLQRFIFSLKNRSFVRQYHPNVFLLCRSYSAAASSFLLTLRRGFNVFGGTLEKIRLHSWCTPLTSLSGQSSPFASSSRHSHGFHLKAMTLTRSSTRSVEH